MANEFDAATYSVSVRKTVEDGQSLFEATVADLPDLVVYAPTAARAHSEMLAVLEVAYQAAVEEGRSFPSARGPQQSEYNGRVTVRMSRSEHARLARCALEEGVSLNSLVVSAIARVLGERDGRMLVHTPMLVATLGTKVETVQLAETLSPSPSGIGSAKEITLVKRDGNSIH